MAHKLDVAAIQITQFWLTTCFTRVACNVLEIFWMARDFNELSSLDQTVFSYDVVT